MRREWIGLAALVAVLALVFGLYNAGGPSRKTLRTEAVRQAKESKKKPKRRVGLPRRVAETLENRAGREVPLPPMPTLPAPEAPVPDGAAGEGAETTEPILHGTDVEGIKVAMGEAAGLLQPCYETLIQDFPEVEGRLSLSFQIVDVGGFGQVQQVEVMDSAVDSTYLEGCAVTSLEDVHFEVPAEPLTVNWPFVFRSDD